MNGFIYIMSNEAFDHNLIKIGKSKYDPANRRASELYTTGVPEKFKVEYYAFVEDFDEVETRVHRALDGKRYRSNREFFSCPVPKAISLIRKSASVKKDAMVLLAAIPSLPLSNNTIILKSDGTSLLLEYETDLATYVSQVPSISVYEGFASMKEDEAKAEKEQRKAEKKEGKANKVQQPKEA